MIEAMAIYILQVRWTSVISEWHVCELTFCARRVEDVFRLGRIGCHTAHMFCIRNGWIQSRCLQPKAALL